MSSKTDKKRNKPKSKAKNKSKNKSTKQDPWGAFWSTTIYTVVFFWVLFPFYSYQLQVILDQRQCKGQTPNDPSQGSNCFLPHNNKSPPYYPCRDDNLPKNTEKGKKCPEEHVKGPDLFHFMLHFARSVFRDGYSILVGEAWIKADEASEKIKSQMDQQQNPSTSEKKVEGMTGGNPVTGAMQMNINNSNSKNVKSGNEIAMNVMESTFGISAKTISSNAKKSMCCKQFQKYGLSEEEMKNCVDKNSELFNYPPFNWLLPTRFGWPYNYIYDDPSAEKPSAYNPDGTDEEASMTRWFGAWFAKTQQRSWSTSRGIWSNVLSFFLPYLHEDLEAEIVSERLDSFIASLNEKINKLDENSGKSELKNITKLTEIKNNFNKIKGSFDRAWKNQYSGSSKSKSKNQNTRQLLYSIMDGSNKTSNINYFKTGLDERQMNDKNENLYLNFFISATKPKELRSWHGTTVFWNFLNGDYRYWFRYLTTLYMPILAMLVVFLAIGTGLFTTPFSSLNRYSAFILPLFFAFGTTLYNMVAMPMEAFYYLIFGAAGKRNNSSKCPYEGGIYQMKRNYKAYWPINLFLTLAIVITSLGSALAADGKSWGVILSAIFPILILLRLVIYVATFLWNIV